MVFLFAVDTTLLDTDIVTADLPVRVGRKAWAGQTRKSFRIPAALRGRVASHVHKEQKRGNVAHSAAADSVGSGPGTFSRLAAADRRDAGRASVGELRR